MTCEEARRLLLEAVPGELDGRRASPLARHLRHCPGCAAAARAIGEADATLEAFLEAPADEAAVDAMVARVLAAPAGAEVVPIHRRRGWLRAGWVSAAAAAIVAGLFFTTRGAPPTTPNTRRVALAGEQPLVQDPGAANVAIIQTDNPDITVLWFF